MEHISGGAETRSGDGIAESHMHMRVPGHGHRSGSDGSSDDDPGSLRERIGDLGGRAGAFAGQVREGVADRLHRARGEIEARGGVLETIRQYPLVAVGTAFSTGFLIAALTARDDESWVVERVRRQLRRMILSGVTAAVAHELRGLVGGDEGFGQLVHSLLDDDDDELDV